MTTVTTPTLCFVTFEHNEAKHLCYQLGKKEDEVNNKTKKCENLCGKFWGELCGCKKKLTGELSFPFLQELAKEEKDKDKFIMKIEKSGNPTTVYWKNSDSMRLDEHSMIRKWSIRLGIYALLVGTLFLFNKLGENVLENKYLKEPPHI
jgi:hypothetical protein